MKPYVIRQHDLLEPLTVTAYYDNNTPVDLSSGVSSLIFRCTTERGEHLFDRPAILLAPNRMRYIPESGDTAVAGKRRGVFIVTFTDGSKPLTFPTRGYIPMIVEEQLASAE